MQKLDKRMKYLINIFIINQLQFERLEYLYFYIKNLLTKTFATTSIKLKFQIMIFETLNEDIYNKRYFILFYKYMYIFKFLLTDKIAKF